MGDRPGDYPPTEVLLNLIWSVVLGGENSPSRPTFLYLDEFQDFLNLPIPAQDMFAQARSKGLPMTVAHQFMGQLSRDLQDAVLAKRSQINYFCWFGRVVASPGAAVTV